MPRLMLTRHVTPGRVHSLGDFRPRLVSALLAHVIITLVRALTPAGPIKLFPPVTPVSSTPETGTPPGLFPGRRRGGRRDGPLRAGRADRPGTRLTGNDTSVASLITWCRGIFPSPPRGKLTGHGRPCLLIPTVISHFSKPLDSRVDIEVRPKVTRSTPASQTGALASEVARAQIRSRSANSPLPDRGWSQKESDNVAGVALSNKGQRIDSVCGQAAS